MSTENQKPGWPGWWFPPIRNKYAHYFKPEDKGVSICKSNSGIDFVGAIKFEAEDWDDELESNCPKCKAALLKLRGGVVK